MFFILNDERHFPYSHLLIYPKVFANKVLQRIRNAYPFISKLWLKNDSPAHTSP